MKTPKATTKKAAARKPAHPKSAPKKCPNCDKVENALARAKIKIVKLMEEAVAEQAKHLETIQTVNGKLEVLDARLDKLGAFRDKVMQEIKRLAEIWYMESSAELEPKKQAQIRLQVERLLTVAKDLNGSGVTLKDEVGPVQEAEPDLSQGDFRAPDNPATTENPA